MTIVTKSTIEENVLTHCKNTPDDTSGGPAWGGYHCVYIGSGDVIIVYCQATAAS